jgi:hypothetical protein
MLGIPSMGTPLENEVAPTDKPPVVAMIQPFVSSAVLGAEVFDK